ncbi:MAG: hypothetical protein GX434_16040 [Peptococcaceae bacterium]|nr:hypothetical protein [Peptococcaceae bacterium]
MSIFEAIMLICFGSAWPFSIYTSYKTRTAKGKSIFFLFVILIGYLSGIIHKILYSFDYVLILYLLNSFMVGIDALLYFRNKRLDDLREQSKI